MKAKLTVITLIIICLVATGLSDPAQPDKDETPTIVRVAGEPISMKQVYDSLMKHFPEEYQSVVDLVVSEKILQQKKRSLRVEVSPVEVDERMTFRIDQFRDRVKIQTQGKKSLEQYIKSQGTSFEEWKVMIKEQTKIRLETEHLIAYDALKNGRAKVHLIMVRNEALAKTILSRVKQNILFSVLAKRNSVHSSGANGGELGYYCRDLFDYDTDLNIFSDYIKDLDSKEFSDVIDVPNGFCIIRLTNITKPARGSYKQLQKKIVRIVQSQTINEKEIHLWMNKIRIPVRLEKKYPAKS